MNTEPRQDTLGAKLLTSDVARVLDVSPDYVRVLERTGKIRAVKTAGGVRLFDRAEVERVARERADQIEQRGR